MPDHLHVLLTPNTSLEKAAQFIKGGFSYRAKKELGSNMEVWQKGFSDHRVRDASDYHQHVIYVRENPVRKHLCQRAEDYPYSSAHSGFDLDPVPQGLKPASFDERGTARLEGVPFQSKSIPSSFEGGSFQNNSIVGEPEGALALSEPSGEPQGLKPVGLDELRTTRLKGVPFQNKPKNKTA